MVQLPPDGKNGLYYGDNWEILRTFPDECVDLIYIDPPFNSDRNYNVVFDGSVAEEKAFEDTWSRVSIKEEEEVMRADPQRYAVLDDYLDAMGRLLGRGSPLYCYLLMMSVRVVELQRVLKPTGSFFLHCDPTASHYLKTLLDKVFGPQHFRNEIVWRRTGSNKAQRSFGPIHDTILFYVKTPKAHFYVQHNPYTKEYVREWFTDGEDSNGKYQAVSLTGPGTRDGDSGKPWRGIDPTKVGRHWQPASYLYNKYTALTGDDLAKYPLHERLDKMDQAGMIHWGKKDDPVPRYKFYVNDSPGAPLQDIWAFIPGTTGCVYGEDDEGIDQAVKWMGSKDAERLGYPTQKPLGLMERVIASASKPGDLVLDAFCGCGTTVAAAEKLGRKWLGIDITFRAVDLIRQRITREYYGGDDREFKKRVYVHGVPQDLESAAHLARQTDSLRKEFEKWGCIVMGGVFQEKKSADGGQDGYIQIPCDDGTVDRCILQVKSGGISVKDAKDLNSTIDDFGGVCGVLFTLEPPTKPLLEYVGRLPPYRPQWGKHDLDPVPKIQIITVEEHFAGKKPNLPGRLKLEKQAQAVQKPGPKQKTLAD